MKNFSPTLFAFFILLSCSKDSPLPAPTATITYTLTAIASEGGTVNNTGGTYNENSNVSITATADAGYEFTSWSGDASGTDNPLTVSMNSNKTITANFIRTQYTLSIGKIGEGTITQEVISSDKTSEEYNSGDVVRLIATPSGGSIFNSWSGSSTETTNQIDVTIDGTKSVTATFEETISQVLAANDTFLGVGKWKIRKKTGGTDTSKFTDCEVSEIIFRTDGTFTIATGTITVTGQFNVDSNTTITLTQEESPFGAITNLVLTNGYISFSISLNSGCTEDATGDRDDTYDEATDTSLPPVISLVGSSTIYLGVGDTFTDAGATAEDSIDGDITSSITSSGTVDTATEGTYLITYTVSDAAGNSVSITRTVIVSLDLPPTITLTGSSTITLLVGDTYIEDGCVATDQEDGDITASITTSGTVDVSNAGSYTLVYSVSDSGNNFVSVTRTVIVDPLPDTTPPTITLTGSSTVNLTVGDTFTDPGAIATDNIDGDITSSVLISGSVDTSSAGTYTISYNVSDAAGNAATVVRRTVIVSAAVSNSGNISFVNGTCQCPNATVGDTVVINGTTYTAVNNSTIAGQIANGNVNLCTTLVTDMSELFRANDSFNSDISFWDTSNVTNMQSMFYGATSFNSDISSWDTLNVTDMTLMFRAANIFNQNIGNWNTSSVTNMNEMFRNAWAFNKNIGSWDTSNVSSMVNMFASAFAFNQNIGNWDTSNVTDMSKQFKAAEVFNQDLTGWCVSSITSEPTEFVNLSSALIEANKPLWGKEFTVALTSGSNSQTLTVTNATTDIVYTAAPICTGTLSASASGFPSGVTLAFGNNVATISGSANATGTFNYTVTISGASTSQVVTGTITVNSAATTNNSGSISFINGTCQCPNATAGDTDVINGVTYAAVDNSTIAGQIANSNVNLCTTLVTSMQNLFSGKANFNSDIGFWDTSNVTNMDRMFENASSFNQDISGWCVSNINSEPINFLFSSALTDANKPVWGTCPNYNINVTASSNSDYTLAGSDRNGAVSGNDPSITINVGDEVNFIVNAASHPFYIKTVQGTGTDNQVSNVTNNGATSGVVNWTPTAAGTYYYQCSVHNGMYGIITVQ